MEHGKEVLGGAERRGEKEERQVGTGSSLVHSHPTLIPLQGLEAANQHSFKIFAVMPHSHLVGRALRLLHVRNGTELPPIVEENSYDFNYQEILHLPREVEILPVRFHGYHYTT